MDYEKLFGKVDEYYSNDRADILPFVPQGVKKTLEFGCGDGNFSALLKERFSAETWAVELNEESARQAAKKLYRVFCSDANHTLSSLPNGYFDCIFFLDFLEHLADPYSMLTECRKKLSDTGVVIASIPNIRYYRAFVKYVFGGNWEYRQHGVMDITHLRFFTYKSIRVMFESLQYVVSTIQGIHSTSSRSYSILNFLFLNSLWDVRYKQFLIVAGKK